MPILRELLKELKAEDNTQAIKQLCDRIQEEEKESIVNLKRLPKGPNIFLALEVPGRNEKEVGFLSLERETEDLYLLVFYTILKSELEHQNKGLRRQKVWEISDHRPEPILTQFAKTYKFLRGE